MIDQQRAKLEEQIFAHYLPSNMFRFRNIGTSSPNLLVAVQANDGATYLLYFDLAPFPASKPRVYVQQMLFTRSGQPMDSASSSNHTLSSWNGWTQLCHYADTKWTLDVSLWKVYLKCRLWIEMYRAHLRTGKTMEYYLNHQV
jgi:hypothetical protein